MFFILLDVAQLTKDDEADALSVAAFVTPVDRTDALSEPNKMVTGDVTEAGNLVVFEAGLM